MKITFLGATGTVTGSKYLLTLNSNKKVLIDCGLYQGYKELRLRNWNPLPVDPAEIDAVILTHAHIDHTGYLPLFVKNGFKGPIYSTPGTKELCNILLPDSGYLQEEDAYHANKYGFSKHKPALPLYTAEDARKVMHQFVTVHFEQEYELYEDFHFSFLRAAHILGSAFIRMNIEGKTIVFTGDIGRPRDPIMREPAKIEMTDYLVLESTYGNRLHDPENPQDQLGKIINETAARGGSVIIPSFAVGRSQSILYYISQLKEKKLIPNLPVFLDSPMAEDVSDIYMRYIDEHHLGPEHCKQFCKVANYAKSTDDSKAIDTYKVPIIVISASGMATGGRVLHHIKTFAPHEKNTILFTGYQAGGTLGARMMRGDREVKIHGEQVQIRAQVEYMTNTSAHADWQEILEWLAHFTQAPRKVFLIHGENEAREALKDKIERELGWPCCLPEYLYSEKL